MKLPEFTYTATGQWPGGQLLTMEAFTADRDAVFTSAAEWVGFGCEVVVECIERDGDGRCLRISDITDDFRAERLYPVDDTCDCGQCFYCTAEAADARYDDMVSDRLHDLEAAE